MTSCPLTSAVRVEKLKQEVFICTITRLDAINQKIRDLDNTDPMTMELIKEVSRLTVYYDMFFGEGGFKLLMSTPPTKIRAVKQSNSATTTPKRTGRKSFTGPRLQNPAAKKRKLTDRLINEAAKGGSESPFQKQLIIPGDEVVDKLDDQDDGNEEVDYP